MATFYDSDEETEPVVRAPKRKTWDKISVHKCAVDTQHLEIMFGEKLKEWFTPELGWTVHWHENPYHRHDFYLQHEAFPEKRVLIELECGKDQVQWVSQIQDNRSRWPFGLNVLSRKIAEGKHYDVFIKYNLTGTSFFAATYDFILAQGRPVQLKKHSLKFKTDATVYSLPWSLVEQPEAHRDFCVDAPTALIELVTRQLHKTS